MKIKKKSFNQVSKNWIMIDDTLTVSTGSVKYWIELSKQTVFNWQYLAW